MAVNWMPNKQHPMKGANPSLRWSYLELASAQLRGKRAEDNKRTRTLESTIIAALVYAFDSPQFPSSQRSIQARSRMRAVGADLRPIWFGGALQTYPRPSLLNSRLTNWLRLSEVCCSPRLRKETPLPMTVIPGDNHFGHLLSSVLAHRPRCFGTKTTKIRSKMPDIANEA
jgi:hypothetical protein